MGQDQPSTEPSAGTWQQLQSRAAQEKHTVGSPRLLETMRQCHLPAGAAGTFRMHQMSRRTSRDVNGSGEKSMQKVTPKISALNGNQTREVFLGQAPTLCHQPLDKLPTSHLAKGKEGFLRSPLLSRKLNSSPVGPAVWVVETFSATKALTPRESTQCEKAALKGRSKWIFYCQIRSSLRGKWAVLSELLHSRQNFPCLHLRWRRIGENRK